MAERKGQRVSRVTDQETGRHEDKERGAVHDRMIGWQGGKAADRRQGAGGFSRLELHIGELVLQGFPGMDPELLGAAVQAELFRLLAEDGLPSRLARAGVVGAVDGGQFTLEASEDIRHLGARIARAVYEGLEGR